MSDRWADAEWKLDCLNSRMDALDVSNKLCNKASSARSDAMKPQASEIKQWLGWNDATLSQIYVRFSYATKADIDAVLKQIDWRKQGDLFKS